MSKSDHISSSDGEEAITIKNEALVRREDAGTGQMDMLAFLKRYGPQFSTEGVKSELDVLRDIGSFRQFLNPRDLKFNYNFDEESYSYYSRLQNVVRIELTQFRNSVVRELYHRRVDMAVPGYYYELGALQPRGLRQADYYDRSRSEGRRGGYYDRPEERRRRDSN